MISQEIINAILRTEKGVRLEGQNKYLFYVSSDANKIQIKKAVEEIYKVKVDAVHVMVVPGKKRRVRVAYGYKPDWKKAIVTLATGSKIETT